MRLYMSALLARADMSQNDEILKLTDSEPVLDARRRRLNFRAWHRGTKETDLMVGSFVANNIAAFTEAELDDLERILEYLDVDLADWLMGRSPIPDDCASPLLTRMAHECTQPGAGLPPELR